MSEDTQLARRRDRGPDWWLRAAGIARAFHVEGLSKIEIAAQEGISRFKVARILEEAQASGMVQVRIQVPGHIDFDLSRRLGESLGLRRSVVVHHHGPEEAARQAVAQAAADLLGEVVRDEDTLGLSCSRTVFAASEQLGQLPACRVVQLTGTLTEGRWPRGGSVESVRNAVAAGAAEGFPVYAPMLLGDSGTADSLRRQGLIATALGLVTQVTVALVSVGGWSPGASTIWEEVDAPTRGRATERGAVGEIGGRTFGHEGQRVDAELDARILGADLDELRGIDNVIGVALGAGRGAAVTAAVRGGMVDSLVCDQRVALAALDSAATTGGGSR